MPLIILLIWRDLNWNIKLPRFSIFYRINNGGHAWPSGSTELPWGATNRDIVASDIIWKFFSKDSGANGIWVNPGSGSETRAYTLSPNFPNPFNPSTTIGYALPEPSELMIAVYDVLGRQIKTLKQGQQEVGSYQIQWNGTDDSGKQVATGIYLCRLQASSFSQTIKMVYIR